MRVAVFFPGIGYHCDKPLLYYSGKIVSELCFDKIIKLEYSYSGVNLRENEEKMKEVFESLYFQAEETLNEYKFTDSDEVLFVSKSVGTIIASAYAHRHKIKCKHVLYTPLKYTYEYPHSNGIAYIGTADPWSDVNEVVRLSEGQGIPIRVFDGLNHSLEGDDTIENLKILNKIMLDVKVVISCH